MNVKLCSRIVCLYLILVISQFWLKNVLVYDQKLIEMYIQMKYLIKTKAMYLFLLLWCFSLFKMDDLWLYLF